MKKAQTRAKAAAVTATKAGDAGAAGGLTDAFRSDGEGPAVGDGPKRKRSGKKGIDR